MTTELCTGCRSPLPAEARFCAQCGLQRPVATGTGQAERRQLTVMFCDLVGSTELSTRVDAEDLRDILLEYQDRSTTVVREFDGYLGLYMGDGILAYFGYPHADEDDAERAIRAALSIQSSMQAMNEERTARGETPVQVRVGIHTGLVVVTDIDAQGHQDTFAVGDTLNLAARLEGIASPGGVVISDATRRLVEHRFVTRDLGPQELKGFDSPVTAHAVERLADDATAFAPAGTVAPLIGRDVELRTLHGAWRRVLSDDGRAIVLVGEPGVGKSRLAHQFRQEIGSTRHRALEANCSRFKAGSAFQPWIELIERSVGLEADESPESRLSRLETVLGELLGDEAAEVVPYLAVLLGLPESGRYPLELMGPELQREQTLRALILPLVALARDEPLVLVCEDVHWADPSTLEVLGRVADELAGLPILLLLTSREPVPSLAPVAVEIHLERLTAEQTRDVVRAALRDGLSDAMLDALAERADGVPLFAQELAKFMLEQGDEDSIPTTLQDSLMGRLDRLGSAKQVAQLGATLGREFTWSLISAASDHDADGLADDLAQLVEADILSVDRGADGDADPTYTFHHALLQEAAYESLLRRTRRELHDRIATTLSSEFPQLVAAEPEVVARHAASGGQTSEAVGHYQLAGDQAVTRIAHAEAYEYYRQALDLLAELPADGERDSREITLRLGQATPLAAMRGYDDAELTASIDQVESLCRDIDEAHRLPALLGIMLYYLNRGLLPRARGYASDLIEVAEPLGIPQLLVVGHMIRGIGAITSATATEACADLKVASDLAETTDMPDPDGPDGLDSKSLVSCTYAMALVVSGRPDTAVRYIERSLQRAADLDHPRTLASILQQSATSYFLMDDPEPCGELSRRGLAVLEGRGLHTVEVSARALAGWAAARAGDPDGLASMDEAIRNAHENGVVGGMANFHCASARLHAENGDLARAMAEIERGTALMEETGEEMAYEPMLAITRAQALLATGAGTTDEIIALLREALELLSPTGSTWIELEAANLLGRVVLDAGRPPAEACATLKDIYGRFDEGLDRPRLREARATIASLEAA